MLCFAEATTGQATCTRHAPCSWHCDTDSSRDEAPEVLPVPPNTGKYDGELAWFFFPVSSILTKGCGGGGRNLSNGFFFLLHFTPTFSAPCNLIFYTSFMCFYSAHLCVFFFFTPLDQLSPHVWHLWLYPSASQCRLAEQHLITGRLWLTGALIMVVGKAQSLPFQQYTLRRKPSTVSQSDKKSQIPPIIIPSLLYLSTFFSKLSYCGWHQPPGRWGWWDTTPERGSEETKLPFTVVFPRPLCPRSHVPWLFPAVTSCFAMGRPALPVRWWGFRVKNVIQVVALMVS